LLTSGSRSALPRQQTLRATLDWSYDLLAEDERAAWRRLAIFSGSFTVEAASGVASDATIDEFSVVDLLSQLVARSLVIADTSAAGTRYRLLETTRAYALDKLGEVGEVAKCRSRHATYFCELFDHAPDDWPRMPDSEWRAAYLPEVDNVRAALDWALGVGADAVLGIRLSGGSGPLWTESGLWNEGRRRLQVALAAVRPETRPLDHARLWFWLGALRNHVATEALDAYEHALEVYRRNGDPTGIGYSLMRAGGEAMYLGRIERATALLGEAAPLLERTRLPKVLAEYLLEFGTLKWFTGDLTGAQLELDKSAALCEQSGAARVALGVRANLAEVAWASGDLDAALVRYREAVALARRETRRPSLGMYLTNLAGVHVERGELDAALVAAREGLPLRQEFGAALWALDHLGLRMALKGKLGTAARIAGHADYGYVANYAAERQPNEARARERVQAILLKTLPPDEVERLLREGAKMSEDEACKIALEE
jgi:tetratricopeptide (TPR) repeat protein